MRASDDDPVPEKVFKWCGATELLNSKWQQACMYSTAYCKEGKPLYSRSIVHSGVSLQDYENCAVLMSISVSFTTNSPILTRLYRCFNVHFVKEIPFNKQ